MLDHRFIAVMVASWLACAAATVGIIVISKYEAWGRKHSPYFVSFAAGLLISVSFLRIIPRSVTMSHHAPAFLLAGFLALFLSDHFLHMYVCNDEACHERLEGVIPMLGITIHSSFDGVIYAVLFNVSVLTGALAALGMVLHEFPEGIIVFVLLQRGGIGGRKAFVWAFLAAALSTPIGALIAYPIIARLSQPVLGAMLAVSAGALVYVSASHLLPIVAEERRKGGLLTLFAGVALAILIIISKR